MFWCYSDDDGYYLSMSPLHLVLHVLLIPHISRIVLPIYCFSVSTLPVAEPLEPLPSAHEIEINIENGSGSSDRGRSPINYQYDHMGGLDVDDEYDTALSIPQCGTMGRRGSLLLSDDTDEELNDTLVDDLKLSVSAWRRRSSAASPAINPPGLTVPAPIVLAELPRLSELARVDRSGNVPDPRASQVCDLWEAILIAFPSAY